jgi:hypothetical protein
MLFCVLDDLCEKLGIDHSQWKPELFEDESDLCDLILALVHVPADALEEHGLDVDNLEIVVVLDVYQQFPLRIFGHWSTLTFILYGEQLVEVQLADEKVGNKVIFNVFFGVCGGEDRIVKHGVAASLQKLDFSVIHGGFLQLLLDFCLDGIVVERIEEEFEVFD